MSRDSRDDTRTPRDDPTALHVRRQAHEAAKRLQDDAERSNRRPRIGRRVRVLVLTTVALFSISVAAPAVLDYVAPDGSRDAGPGAPKSDQPVPPGSRPSLAVAQDPVEKRYPWGVRAFPSAKGDCVLTGRLLGGHIGRLQDGKFARFGPNMSGVCGSLRRSHIVFVTKNYYKLNGGRTVLAGITDRRVASLDLLTAGDVERRSLRIADDNSFVAVRIGSGAFRGQRLRIAFTNGRTVRIPLQPGPPPKRPATRRAP